MRKLKLLMMTVCALMGAGQAWAAVTDYLTTENGWSQVTSASGITTDGSCVYVIASEFENLVVGIPGENSDAQLTYQTLSGQPKRQQVWYIEADTYGTGGYALKNLARSGYYLTANKSGDIGPWSLVATDSEKGTKYTCYQFSFDGSGNLLITTHEEVGADPGLYWGDWSVGSHANGNTLAGNKKEENRVTFKLYKKSLFSGKQDVTFLLGNPDFEGSYSSIFDGKSRHVYQPEGWTTTRINGGNENDMTILESTNDGSGSFSGFTINTSARGSKTYWTRVNWGANVGINLKQSLTLPVGAYVLSVEVNNYSGNTNNNVHIKIGTRDVTVTRNGSKSDSNWQTIIVGFNSDGSAQDLQFIINHVTENTEQIVGVDNFKLYSLSDNADITSLFVKNPTFDSNSTGWTTYMNPTNNKISNNKDGTTNFWENWKPANEGRMYQAISNLPSGTYQLRMMAFAQDKGVMTPANTDASVYAKGAGEIHRNYVNSTDFTYYNTYAYVGSAGSLEIGFRQDANTFEWVGIDNVSLSYVGSSNQEDALLFAELQSKWSAVKSAISTAANGTYSNVTGSEKTALTSALSTASGQSISAISDYATYAAPLNTAFSNVINAKVNYDKFDVEKENALLMGVDENDVVRPASKDDLLTAMRGLYVLEDAATTSDYTVDATNIFGTWEENNTGTNHGQHWSGDDRNYIDRQKNEGYTMYVKNKVTLPKGHYVFKAAARAHADGVNGAFNMSVKKGSADAVYKHYNAQGDVGKGIDTSGAVNYGDGTFCNDGAGRGWEWRLFAFDLNESTEVEMQVYAQILANKWVSFSDIGLFTTEDNIGICEMMWDNALAAAEAARDNKDYNNVTGKERTDLLAAISDAETEPETSAGYKEQETALINATNAFIAVKDTYDEYAQESVVAEELGVDVPAISSATTAATLISNMQTMNVSDYSAATTNYTYNATSLLRAWSNAPGNNHGQSWNGTTGDGSDEYYDLYNAAARSMTQTVTLPKAKYVLIAKGRASTDGRLTLSDGTNTITFPHKGNDGKGIKTDGTPNFGSGTYSNDGNGNGWEYRFLTFESDGSTSTTLTFNWTTASNNWAGLDDITLLAIPKTVTIAENDTEAPDYSIADVTLTRTLSASYWNTFSVPFDMDIPDGWTVKEFDSATDNVITFKDATTIEAGKPYLVKPTANVVNPTYSSVIVQNTEGSTVGEGDYKFAAQIYNKTLATDGTIAYLATDGKVKKLTSGGLKGLRAYFIIPAGAEARIAFLDDETTGITEMKQQSNSEEMVIYDLNGRRVQNMQKGIYIVNGKKIVK